MSIIQVLSGLVKKFAMLAIAALTVAMASCATIPPEAVELSKTLGQMISKAKAAHISMVDQHFDQIALRVDKFARGEYKAAVLDKIRRLAKQKDPNFTDLSLAQYDKMMTTIDNERQVWLNSVWANKQVVLKSLEDYYSLMEQASAEVTNFIRSAAGVENTRNKLINDVTSQFGIQSKDLENKLMGSATSIDSALNSALQKVFGD